MMTHQRKGQQHLARKAPDQRSRKANETVRFDKLIKINAEELHCNAQVVPEVKVFSHLDHMVFLFRVLEDSQKSQRKNRESGNLPICGDYQES